MHIISDEYLKRPGYIYERDGVEYTYDVSLTAREALFILYDLVQDIDGEWYYFHENGSVYKLVGDDLVYNDTPAILMPITGADALFTLDGMIVVGSGVLGELNIRQADDVDLVVTQSVFESLAGRDGWHYVEKHESPVYINDDLKVEAWLDWAAPDKGGSRVDFDELLPHTVVLHGVRFVTLEYVRAWKQWCGRDKDVSDIALIDAYRESKA